MRARSVVSACVAAILAMTVAGCGGDDADKADTTGPNAANVKFTLAQACTAVSSEASVKVTTSMSPWLYGRPLPATPARPAGYDPLAYIDTADNTQRQLKAEVDNVAGLTTQLDAAVAAKDDAKAQQIVNQIKVPYDAIITTCKDVDGWTSKDLAIQQRAMLDKKPARLGPSVPSSTPPAPTTTSSKPAPPQPLTPKGATVQVGQPVVIDYTEDGKTGRFFFRVTEIHKATDQELAQLSSSTREKAKQIYFIRSEVKATAPDTGRYESALPSLVSFDPKYKLATSINAYSTSLILFGKLDSCKDEDLPAGTNGRTLCGVYAVLDPSATVSAASVTAFGSSGSTSDAALYTWKN